MLKKPKPIVLSEKANQAIQGQLNVQSQSKATPKSTDPKNFPVFEVPTNKKVLIYVPNHLVEGPDGEELRMDKPLIHSVQDGKRFLYYRCINGITYSDIDENTGKEIEVYDGSCPLCDSTSAPWDLANLKIKQKCQQASLDPDDRENAAVKAIRSAEFSGRVLKESNRYFTFPIVVIDTVNDDGKTMAVGEDGNPILTPMWYHISEAQYNKKWQACLEGIEDEPSHPGGRFFVLNFIYDTKGKEANKRDAAQNLTVISRDPKNAEKLKATLDKATEGWTPEKAQETVITNHLYSKEDLQAIADELLLPVNEMISLIEATQGIADTSTGFNLQKPQAVGALESSAGIPAMDETDDDFGAV